MILSAGPSDSICRPFASGSCFIALTGNLMGTIGRLFKGAGGKGQPVPCLSSLGCQLWLGKCLEMQELCLGRATVQGGGGYDAIGFTL